MLSGTAAQARASFTSASVESCSRRDLRGMTGVVVGADAGGVDEEVATGAGVDAGDGESEAGEGAVGGGTGVVATLEVSAGAFVPWVLPGLAA
jgi:hypothetical protein